MKNVSYIFVVAQIIGIVAWLFLFFSYYRKNTKRILFFQIICSILFIIHYFLLGAFSGVLTCFFDLIFDSAYYLVNYPRLKSPAISNQSQMILLQSNLDCIFIKNKSREANASLLLFVYNTQINS